MAAQIPLEQALQNLFTVERADGAGLEKLGGATYAHWLSKEIRGSPADGVDKATARQLLDVGKRLWNRCLLEAKGASGGAGKLNAAVRMLALTAMSIALQHPELRLFGDEEKKRAASNLCKLAHEFATELDDAPCAERCCALAQELLDSCALERVLFHRAHVHCAHARVALQRDDAEHVHAALRAVSSLLCDERAPATDTLQLVEVAGLLVSVARSAVDAAAPSPARAALVIDVFDAALRVCEIGLAQCGGDVAMAAPSEDLARLQTAARLLQAVLWSDMPDASTLSRALDTLLSLPAPKQREPLVRLCTSKVLGRLGRAADATHRTLEVVADCDDFDTCFAAAMLLEHDGQHEARVEALRSIAERGLDRGDVRRWSAVVKERFVALHASLRDAERALAHLDEAMATHQSGEHVLSAEVLAFIHDYLYHEFACEFERGAHLALAAEYAAKAAEWCPTDRPAKRLNALRMAAWSHLKLGQPAQALAFARRAVAEEPLSPKSTFLLVLASTGLARSGGGAETPMDEVERALDTLLDSTAFDASCLEVLSSSALEEGHTEIAVALLSRWLQRGPTAAANGKLLACVQQLHRVQLGGRDACVLDAAEVRAMGAHVRVAVSRLGAFGADASHGSEDEVWWTAALAWNLALRAKALGEHQLMLECLQAALLLADRLESGVRQMRFAFECNELMACELCAHLDAALGAQPPADAERVARAAAQARTHAGVALRLHDALEGGAVACAATDGGVASALADTTSAPDASGCAAAGTDAAEQRPVPSPPPHAAASTERSAAAARARSRLVTVELEMQLFEYAFPLKGAPALTVALLAQRLDEAASALAPEQVEHIAQRSLSLEPRAQSLHPLTVLGYRRACDAYQRALDGRGTDAPAAALSARVEPFVRLCHCAQRMCERLSDADACIDTDLGAKLGGMLAAAETRLAARPAGWPVLLEWLVDKASRWATRASRADKLIAAEAWMSRAINLQAALLGCVDAARRPVEEEVLKALQPKYEKILASIARGGDEPHGFVSPLKAASMLHAVVP